jgi:hypothetical protein
MRKRILLSLIIAISLIGVFSIPAFAATTADVTVTATPTYIAMTNGLATWSVGVVAESGTYWWDSDGAGSGAAPSSSFDDGEMATTITNTGSVAEDIDVHCHAATGGVGWAVSTDDSPGANEYSLRAGITGTANEAAMIQVITTDSELIDSLAAAGTKKWIMELETGTFTDGVEKSFTVTLTASAAN